MSRIEITSDPILVVSGRGMIARQQIERGALIQQELPLIMVKVERSKTMTDNTLHQFYQSQEHPNGRLLIDAVNALSAPEMTAFGNLARSAPIAGALPLTQRQEIVARFRHNAWGINGQNTYLVVYDMMSSLNHSCVPNAVVDIWNGDPKGDTIAPLGQVRLIATMPIPEGSEVFLNYYTDQRFNDHTVRIPLLQADYGFLCTCSGCHSDSAAIDAAERAAAKQYHEILATDPPLTTPEIRRRIERMEVYIHLLQHLGVWDAEVSEVCCELARLHISQSNYRKAISAAATGLNVQKHFYSDEGAVALKQELGAESTKCQVNDSSLIQHITGTGSIYPLY